MELAALDDEAHVPLEEILRRYREQAEAAPGEMDSDDDMAEEEEEEEVRYPCPACSSRVN